ncbi:hypothetical protein [Micavibrio aeruginosavorus]|uniref:hypothetical protein n=1 Tax=Micavibrio aeruginosavorus TaxID=349221 RepID=UPI0003494832|nr:hypothetical protein [Micavibrio aeruginosavorus]
MPKKSLTAAFNAACNRFFELAREWENARSVPWDAVDDAHQAVLNARDDLQGARLSPDEWDDVIQDIIAVSDTYERLKPQSP